MELHGAGAEAQLTTCTFKRTRTQNSVAARDGATLEATACNFERLRGHAVVCSGRSTNLALRGASDPPPQFHHPPTTAAPDRHFTSTST